MAISSFGGNGDVVGLLSASVEYSYTNAVASPGALGISETGAMGESYAIILRDEDNKPASFNGYDIAFFAITFPKMFRDGCINIGIARTVIGPPLSPSPSAVSINKREDGAP